MHPPRDLSHLRPRGEYRAPHLTCQVPYPQTCDVRHNSPMILIIFNATNMLQVQRRLGKGISTLLEFHSERCVIQVIGSKIRGERPRVAVSSWSSNLHHREFAFTGGRVRILSWLRHGEVT